MLLHKLTVTVNYEYVKQDCKNALIIFCTTTYKNVSLRCPSKVKSSLCCTASG